MDFSIYHLDWFCEPDDVISYWLMSHYWAMLKCVNLCLAKQLSLVDFEIQPTMAVENFFVVSDGVMIATNH